MTNDPCPRRPWPVAWKRRHSSAAAIEAFEHLGAPDPYLLVLADQLRLAELLFSSRSRSISCVTATAWSALIGQGCRQVPAPFLLGEGMARARICAASPATRLGDGVRKASVSPRDR